MTQSLNKKVTYVKPCPYTGLALVHWKIGDRRFEPLSGLQVSKKQLCFYPLTRNDSIARPICELVGDIKADILLT